MSIFFYLANLLCNMFYLTFFLLLLFCVAVENEREREKALFFSFFEYVFEGERESYCMKVRLRLGWMVITTRHNV